MLDVIDNLYLRTKIWFSKKKEAFLEDERGVSGIVAAIVLLMIALVLVAVFWEKINAMVTDWWSTIDANNSKLPK